MSVYRYLSIVDFQADFIVWIQSARHPACDLFFKYISELGTIQAMLITWAIFVWFISYRYGCRIILVNLVLQYFGSLWLKALVALPRPSEIFPAIIAIEPAKGFSFPSGHVINAIIFWGMVALFFKKRWVTFACTSIIFLIGLSRIYLGVHYPMDVLASFAMGGAALFCFEKKHQAKDWLCNVSDGVKVGGILGSSLVLYGLVLLFAPQGIPPSWFYSFVSLYTSSCLGWLLKNRWILWSETVPWSQRFLRTAIGMIVLLVPVTFYFKSFWTYWFIGFWLTLGVPLLFAKIVRAVR